MKKTFFLIFISTALLILSLQGCGDDDKKTGEAYQVPEASGENTDPIGYQPEKAQDILAYNIQERKKTAQRRTPCDTIALMEHVFYNYPEGSYLLDIDPRYTYSMPKSAVIYQRGPDGANYVFALIATSRQGERLIEIKNIVGYDASFIDLDSTKLGTAFFYLTLFRCQDSTFTRIWEVPIPNHGGFNLLSMEKWKNTPYVRSYFHYARGIGRLDYNYFLIDGLTEKPHLLLTIEAINRKRAMIDLNKDKYPDYVEYFYLDTGDRIRVIDSVGFVWKDSLYVSMRDKNKTTPY